MRSKLFAVMRGGAATVAAAPSASAYPIDCAILLCLAGGFPASAECSAAKAEFIRRITPWPIEPPLQLWNCPMRSSGGISVPGIGADGLTDDVRRYRDGIEIYHVQMYYHKRGGDNEYITDELALEIEIAESNIAHRASLFQVGNVLLAHDRAIAQDD